MGRITFEEDSLDSRIHVSLRERAGGTVLGLEQADIGRINGTVAIVAVILQRLLADVK